MGNFEDYTAIQRDKQKRINTQQETTKLYESVYNTQKDLGLGNIGESSYEMPAEYITEQFNERIEQSEFEERTRYYFEDPKYMEAKAERYRALANDEYNEVALFAEQHTYRSAKKRKKKAKKAAAAFEKAQKIEEKINKDRAENGDTVESPIQQYWMRNAIMRARMEGMIAAAKVKATDKTNEGYRIAKAKLSCLTILLDQAKNLQDEKSQKNFKIIQKNLEKEISDVTESLKKYSQNKWMVRIGANEPGLVEKLSKETKNPELTKDDVETFYMLESMAEDFKRPEYVEANSHYREVFGDAFKPTERRDEIVSMTYFVKRDKNGMPLDKEELKKEKWNKEWLKACSDKTREDDRRRMVVESLNRIKDVKLPTMEELDKKGLMYFIKQDARLFEIIQKALRIDNLGKVMPFVKDYLAADKLMGAKYDYAVYLGMYFNFEKSKLGIKDSSAGKTVYELEEEPYPLAYRKKDFAESIQTNRYLLEDAEKKLAQFQETGFPVSYEEAKKTAKLNNNKAFNEKSYNIYRSYENSSQVSSCPMYMAIFAPIKNKYGTSKDISRLCGSMFRTVHFDKYWQPISEKDKEAHAWNLKYLNNLVKYMEGTEKEGDKVSEKKLEGEQEKERKEAADTLKKMVEDEMARYFLGQFNLPRPEDLRKELVEPLKKGQPINCKRIEEFLKNTDELALFYTKTLTFEGTYKNLPFLSDFNEKHPEYAACQAMQTVFTTFIIPGYTYTKYGVSMNAACSINNLTKTGMVFNDPAILESYIGAYEQYYNDYLKTLNKNK